MEPEAVENQPSTSGAVPPSSPLRALFAEQQAQQAGAFWSPKSRITFSDRFIPSRAAAARLDFSILDREIVTSEVSKHASEREVRAPALCYAG